MKLFSLLLVSLCTGFFILLPGCAKKAAVDEPLLCYVGGTMRPALEALKKVYETKTGAKVDFDQGESGTLIVKINETRKGDLYVAHDPFMAELKRKGFEDTSWTMALVRPVIVVAKGNPKKITGIKSLGDKGIRLILTHPQYSTMGHIVPLMAQKAGIAEAIKANTVSETRSGGEAANAVGLGTADAAIVWNAVAYLRTDKIDTVTIEPDYRTKSGVDAVTTATFGVIDMGRIKVTMSTLTTSKNKTAARAFAEFCASPENVKIWKDYGFCICQGKEEKQ